MILRDVVERFEKKTAFAVMVRATLANILAAERMDAIFEAHARRQRNDELLFSSVADIMGAVACRIHPSVHAAYQDRIDELSVTAKAIYDKLQGVEPQVSRAVVRETASQMGAIIGKTKATLPDLLPGYRVKIVDGNHLRRTERRIGELREINGAPLPGHAAAVLDPRLGLVIDVIPCEDGHAQERTLLPELLETVEPGDVWIADRNFCTTRFLMTIASRRAYFVIRQHGQCLRYELIGKRKRIAATDTGIVYEQSMRIYDDDGKEKKIRRITIHLYEATRDGDVEIHILTNLPRKVTAVRIAELYGKRWKIETAFQEVAENLHGEVVTLGYPKAALFAFCMALLAYNVLSVIKAAMRAAHGEEKIEQELSIYYVADEVASTYRGLDVAVPDSYWEEYYSRLTPAKMARELVRLAQGVNLRRYRKHKRGPKKPPTKFNKKKRSHVSTARILAQRDAP
jgi:IS4 transposase